MTFSRGAQKPRVIWGLSHFPPFLSFCVLQHITHIVGRATGVGINKQLLLASQVVKNKLQVKFVTSPQVGWSVA